MQFAALNLQEGHCLSQFSLLGGIKGRLVPPPPLEVLKTRQTTPRALTQALAGTFGSCPPPRPVIEERQALLTVHPVRVMFAITHQLVKLILHTLAGMSITFTPGERGDAPRMNCCKFPEMMQKNYVHRELKTT